MSVCSDWVERMIFLSLIVAGGLICINFFWPAYLSWGIIASIAFLYLIVGFYETTLLNVVDNANIFIGRVDKALPIFEHRINGLESKISELAEEIKDPSRDDRESQRKFNTMQSDLDSLNRQCHKLEDDIDSVKFLRNRPTRVYEEDSD